MRPVLRSLLLVATCGVLLMSSGRAPAQGATAAAPGPATTVRLGGTGSALGTMALMAQAFHKLEPGFMLQVVPNLGSSGGIKALAGGTLHLAVISRPLRPEERSGELRAMPYGRTPFVLATAKPGVQGLTSAQVADLYAGRQPRWPDGQPVRLVLRPRSDADSDLLAAFSPEVKAALGLALGRDGMVTGLTDQEAVDAIERLPGGLGTASLSLLLSERRQAQALAIDGVAPTAAELAAGRYVHVKPMALVLGPATTPLARRFAEFVLSPAGRRILADTGHAPPADAAPGSKP